jgi:hypothetical protein
LLLRNFAPLDNNSILVRAITSKRDAIGGRVTVTAGNRKQMDEARSGGSFMSQNDFRLHFGIGKAASADISVRRQDGTVENLTGVAANQVLTIEEGKAIVSRSSLTPGTGNSFPHIRKPLLRYRDGGFGADASPVAGANLASSTGRLNFASSI